ncbi:hypothetical protein B0T22DRAFT_67001 [Podospora appendiculata]|uniref:Small ribosomal subunit protein uS11m n=1 Tax=Podospora appendiculata TaxID=314037 RepID=A0AAE0XIZ5_9PEZI|nr:hypothetical protein B0T22DRAFT_67001 [Podospora appendiculata]
MSRFSTSRLLARDLFQAALPKSSFVAPTAPQWTRLFSQSRPARKVDVPQRGAALPSTLELLSKSSVFARNVMKTAEDPTSRFEGDSLAEGLGMDKEKGDEPYHFHIYATKHNTHITLSKPNRDTLLSLSCGNLGFRKSQRKHYDSAYQLGAYVVDKMHQKGLVAEIHKLEVVLRGFGPGREAVTKVLMGSEGKKLREKITRVADATRTKFGGTRSPKPRRLG